MHLFILYRGVVPITNLYILHVATCCTARTQHAVVRGISMCAGLNDHGRGACYTAKLLLQ